MKLKKTVKKEGILAIVMAGGKGERLYPLTLERSKPSVPFGGRYRIIDLVLSNLVNSGIYSIYVLVQYKSQSLIEHIRTGWRRQGVSPRHFITVVPPQMRRDELPDWYRGTADSVYQNINLILDFSPKAVAVFGGDHIYRMNIKEMVNFHFRAKADVTIACVPFPTPQAQNFGILETNEAGEVVSFQEKPNSEKLKAVENEYSLVSMGNYIFDTDILIDNLLEDSSLSSSHHDFGRDIIPRLIKKARVFAYDFSRNRIPGLKDYEEKAYWRDVGNIKSFFDANMDLLGECPRIDLSNQYWPIYASSLELPPAKINKSEVVNSLISEGVIISRAQIRNSILGRGVIVEKGCLIEDSIVMDFTQIRSNTRVKKTIIDRFNIIEPDSYIGCNTAEDGKRYFVDKEAGIVVVKRGPRRLFHY